MLKEYQFNTQKLHKKMAAWHKFLRNFCFKLIGICYRICGNDARVKHFYKFFNKFFSSFIKYVEICNLKHDFSINVVSNSQILFDVKNCLKLFIEKILKLYLSRTEPTFGKNYKLLFSNHVEITNKLQENTRITNNLIINVFYSILVVCMFISQILVLQKKVSYRPCFFALLKNNDV